MRGKGRGIVERCHDLRVGYGKGRAEAESLVVSR